MPLIAHVLAGYAPLIIREMRHCTFVGGENAPLDLSLWPQEFNRKLEAQAAWWKAEWEEGMPNIVEVGMPAKGLAWLKSALTCQSNFPNAVVDSCGRWASLTALPCGVLSMGIRRDFPLSGDGIECQDCIVEVNLKPLKGEVP
jgi:hypothetical protein